MGAIADGAVGAIDGSCGWSWLLGDGYALWSFATDGEARSAVGCKLAFGSPQCEICVDGVMKPVFIGMLVIVSMVVEQG